MSGFSLRVGLKLLQQAHSLGVQRDVWRIADEGGFDHLWAYDHLSAMGGNPELPIYDGWTVLGAMAEVTRRIRIGLNVSGNLYRHPGLLAKLAVTVDHLSGGRLEFGIGAGWTEGELAMLGMPFPGPADRVGMLEESCRVIKSLWSEPRTTFAGRYYRLTGAIAEPKPLQRPRPPFWVGGSGPRRTLRVVAEHADVWCGQDKTLESFLNSARILDAHCTAVGRDPGTIRRAVQVRYQSGEKALGVAAQYVKAGFTDILLRLDTADPRAQAEEAARDLLPRIRSLGA